MNCWECGAPVAAMFCEGCEAIQPPDPRLDHFARLGVEHRFEQDPDALAAAHRTLQRKVHPDRFASAGDRPRRFSMAQATALNDAIRVLRDPLRRAEYMLHLRGRDVGAEGEGRVQLSPAFLMEIIELREAVDELNGPDAHTERGRMAREVAARFEGMLAELGRRLDAGDDDLDAMAQLAAQLRYLRRVIDELQVDDGPGDWT
ncbi:MAG: Fe-S protein assembly co-chaperone HscB [Myxococcales bacterium]|nr:Fe-S protein assembly co-chaperone HscB [Myxococcales bacterium]MCB9539883.1 Fe-S protein assembly co-chaperone HscB [Myxococcales bacterium]